ncbi:tripartite tricarboxylate transporter TctB family protein [Palleronia sp. KMU-117]|uniref:tripartite tricarboxylate transporter TctB family protein n=1 Tax=Palleronia sp. KMU-117 TaxID=3434108 RepID=UPI003D73FC7D
MLTKRAADIGVALILLTIGIALFTGGLTMDRLENRHIHPASFPGLVPMILGAVMSGMSVLLLIGLRRAPTGTTTGAAATGAAATGDDGDFARDEIRRLAAVGGLCLFYALVLVGNVHFWLASSLFIGVFTSLFDAAPDLASRRKALRLAAIALFAVVMGGAISILFEKAFLVRLP